MIFKLKEWALIKEKNHKVNITKEDIFKMYKELKDKKVNGFIYDLEVIQ
jgi:hypothetical protein